MNHRITIVTLVLLLAAAVVGTTQAGVFNMPAGQTSLEFVTVGDAGNTGQQSRLAMYGDPTYYGAVDYTYRIGKYDVTIAQYCQFLNAVAKTDPYGLYDEKMDSSSYYSSFDITRNGTDGNYSYAITGSYSEAQNCPIFAVDWGSAARFCNWLQNGQPTGAPGPGTTENGAYTLNGATTNGELQAVTRNAGAEYFIPTENEWYKAAFYKGGGTDAGYWAYPTQSDSAPSNVLSTTGTNNANFYDGGYTNPTNHLTPVGTFAGSPGFYGTYDMAGNLWNWNEVAIGSTRGLRGGDCYLDASYLVSSYRDYYSSPADGWSTVTFRVASVVPEPGSVTLLAGIALMLSLSFWRKNRN